MPKKLKSAGAISAAVLSTIIILFSFQIYYSTSRYYGEENPQSPVSIREFPYPYKAALTICSDIDATDSLKEFLTIQEFLNTRNLTVMGKGLGLEIGNSFFPTRKDELKFSLMSKNPHDQEVIIDLIKLGYIDFIHSFNTARDRQEIKGILNILSENNCKIDVWVNHAKALSDVGPYEWCLGDNPDSNMYHTDISKQDLGYTFVWVDDVSGILGQGRPLSVLSFFDAFDASHPFQSLGTNVFKEVAKYTLAILGNDRYAMRKYNDLTTIDRLDDGQHVFKFMRSSVAYYGIGPAANSDGLADLLTRPILQKLIDVGGYVIIYTHLGKNKGFPYISPDTQQALRLLAKEYRDGDIYVTTTARLLNYYVNKKYLIWRSETNGNRINIHIEGISDPVRGAFTPTIDDLRGITFYTDNPANTHIFIRDNEISGIRENEPDHENRKSVMIKLKPLVKLDEKMKEYHAKGYF